jgi:hypothetical protein
LAIHLELTFSFESGRVELLMEAVQNTLERFNFLLGKSGFDLFVNSSDDGFCPVAFLGSLGGYVNPDGAPITFARFAQDHSRSFKPIDKTRQSGVFHDQGLAQFGHGLPVIALQYKEDTGLPEGDSNALGEKDAGDIGPQLLLGYEQLIYESVIGLHSSAPSGWCTCPQTARAAGQPSRLRH